MTVRQGSGDLRSLGTTLKVAERRHIPDLQLEPGTGVHFHMPSQLAVANKQGERANTVIDGWTQRQPVVELGPTEAFFGRDSPVVQGGDPTCQGSNRQYDVQANSPPGETTIPGCRDQ